MWVRSILVVSSLLSVQGSSSVFVPSDDAITEATNPDNQLGDDYQSVMAGLRDYSEEANLRRYRLQLLLIDREPKLRAGLEAMFAKLAALYQNMQGVRNAVAKQTTVIDADATAGGLYAASRELMAEIPATQKLMNTVFDNLYKALVRDSKAINETLAETEEDYRARMQASASIVTTLLARMDKDFAAKAYAQEAAMRKAAADLQSKSLVSLNQQDQQTNKTRDLISQISQSIGESTARVASVVSQFSTMPTEVQNVHKKRVAMMQSDFQNGIAKQQSDAEDLIQKNVDNALTAIQKQGMQIAQQFQRQVTATQDSVVKKLSDVEDLVERQTAGIKRSVNSTVTEISGKVKQIQDNSTRVINQISRKSDLVANDALKAASDARDILTQLASKLGMSRQDFVTSLGKVKAGLPAKLQAVLQRMLNVNQGMNSDLVQALLSENGGVAYIGKFTDEQLARLALAVDPKIAKTRSDIADQGFNTKAIIDQLMGAIDKNNRDVNTNTALAVGQRQQSLQAILSSMGGSIDDLMTLLGDSSSSSQNALNQIRDTLLNMNSDSLVSVLNRVRDLSTENSDRMETFVRTIVGPNTKLTDSQFKEIAGMLTTLLALEQSIEEQQNALMMRTQVHQARTAANITELSDRIQQATTRSLALAQQIGGKSEGRLAALKALLSSESMKASTQAQAMATESVNSIDSMFANLDTISRGIHKTVAQSISSTESNLNQAGKQLGKLGIDSAQSINQLSAVALSIISEAEKAQSVDLSAAKTNIEKLRNDFLTTFKRNASANVDQALADVTARLQTASSQEASLKDLVSSIQDGLDRMKSDLSVAGKYSDNQTVVLKERIAKAEQRLASVNFEIKTGLSETINAFQQKLRDKETYLNSTGTDLNNQLNQVKSLVIKAQDQLRRNLAIYKTRIDDVVNEIRSYMNLSSNADELAISHDIANQLASVNATQVQLVSIRGGINDTLIGMKSRQISTTNRTRNVIEEILQTASNVAAASWTGRTANLEKLTAVGLSVDQQANKLRETVLSAAADMQSKIQANRNATSELISKTESEQATRLADVQRDASNVESQARKRYLENLFKIGSLNDDLGRTTKQLAQLLDNTNATIDDISESAMAQMDLGFQTLSDLNRAESRKIASVQDVMNAFSSVALMFLNETEGSMLRVMSDMNLLDKASKGKLVSMRGRTDDEVNWLGTNLNSTVEKLQLSLEQDKAVQDGLRQALLTSKQRLVKVREREDFDIATITSQIRDLEGRIRTNSQSQIAKVRAWIAKRSPELANQLLAGKRTSSSFLEKRKRIISKDMHQRLMRVKRDLMRLERE